MNPTNPQTPQPQLSHNPLSAMRQGEQVIFEIKRHPIGMIGIYLSFGILLAMVAASAITAPDILSDFDRTLVSNIGLATFLVTSVLAAIFVYIAHKVYYGNRWILTSDSLTQITRNSLFSTQNSQLGLDNLEDVTVHQDGILTHIFNYGVLRGQTAGEFGKFVFMYCPNPNEFAQKMLKARESFEHGEHVTQPQAPQQPTPPTGL